MEGICTFFLTVFASLGKAGKFLGASFFPKRLVLAVEEVAVFFEFSSVGVEDGVKLVKGVDGLI